LAVFPNGEHELVKSNWRLAAENGGGASHIYNPRNSTPINLARRPPPPASHLLRPHRRGIGPDGGPEGGGHGAGPRTPGGEAEIEGVKIASQYRPGVNTEQGSKVDTSLWLPCGLKVDPFPRADCMQFEWYVPNDEQSHHYIVTWGKRVKDSAQAEEFF